MSPLHSDQPIGIFDSGIGGLTVAKALVQRLPAESIIYFGDTAHMPYGDKSVAAIQAYAIKIAHMLLQHNCKLILIACNTASAVAYELVKEYVGKQALVVNVVDPTVAFLHEHYAHRKVGLIATRPTVNSNIYRKKLDALNNHIALASHATPLLASAIEEGFRDHKVIESLLEAYLSCEELKEIDALVLACTHYPIIKHKVAEFYRGSIDIIDTSDIVAQAVHNQLQSQCLLTQSTTSTKHFYVSDYTESFVAGTQLFFQELIKLEHYPLWD